LDKQPINEQFGDFEEEKRESRKSRKPKPLVSLWKDLGFGN
jgi:nucleoid DNA-binding protein